MSTTSLIIVPSAPATVPELVSGFYTAGTLPRARCTGRGICAFSKAPHLWLSGSDHTGFKTKIKAAYPTNLCNLLAKIFIDSMINAYSALRWDYMTK